MLGVLPWQSIFTFCDQRIILYVMFGAIFLVQSNLCEALLVWVQQCLLQVKAMNMYPFSFSFMVQFMALIISTVTSYIRMMNKMEMLRNESVMYQLIYHVCQDLPGRGREILGVANVGVGTLSVRNVRTQSACLLIVYAAYDGCISFIYCLWTQSLGI